MLGASPYYFRLIRKSVIAFGNLFKDMTMIKYTNDDSMVETGRLVVPLMYEGKENFITRLLDNPDLSKAIEISLPRMSFELDPRLTYFKDGKQSSFNTSYASTSGSGVNQQMQGVPYLLTFHLYLYVRNIEDGLQLIEQILPVFNPDYTITINYVPQMGISRNIPILLTDVNFSNDYQGDGPEKERILIWELTFTMPIQFFGPISNGSIITTSTANIYSYGQTLDTATVELFLNANNSFGDYQYGEAVYQGANLPDSQSTGFVSVWDNVSHRLVLSNVNGFFMTGENIIGANSQATWNVSQTTPDILLASIVETPNPANANISSDFGFTDSIIEFPKTV